MGRPKSDGKLVPLTVRLRVEVLDWLTELAEARDKTVAEYVRDSLTNSFERARPTPTADPARSLERREVTPRPKKS